MIRVDGLPRTMDLTERRPLVLYRILLLMIFAAGCTLTKQYPRDNRAAHEVSTLMTASENDRYRQEKLVISLGEGAMPEIYDSLGHPDEKKRVRLIEAASSIGKPKALLVEIFQSGLLDSSSQVKAVSAFRAGQHRDLLPSLLIELRALLRDEDPQVRSTAYTTLGLISNAQKLTAEELVRGMHDIDFQVIARAAAVASQRNEKELRTESQQALVNLLSALEDPSPTVRASTVYAFGQYGEKASSVVAPLILFIEKEQIPEVQLQTALALMRIGTPAAIRGATPTLRKFSQSKFSALSSLAKNALKRVK